MSMVTTRVTLTVEFEQHVAHSWDMKKYLEFVERRVRGLLDREKMRVTEVTVEPVKGKKK